SIQERAAFALLAIGSAAATSHVLEYVARTVDRAAALRIVRRVAPPRDGGAAAFLEPLGAALGRVGPDHPIYEPLLERKVAALEELADRVAWPSYQSWLAERWVDPVRVGALSVEVPLRSVPNALRTLRDRRIDAHDSPLSVTEWSRLMLFFAVDHASGAKNV